MSNLALTEVWEMGGLASPQLPSLQPILSLGSLLFLSVSLAMGDVTDYQFAYFNNIIYNEQDPDGPVSDFDVFSESGRLESGLAATTYIREDQVFLFHQS